VLAAGNLMQGAQPFDLGGVGPHYCPLDIGVRVASGPAAPDPGVEGDLGHAQVLGQVA
jgi:hypothetical protein